MTKSLFGTPGAIGSLTLWSRREGGLIMDRHKARLEQSLLDSFFGALLRGVKWHY